MQKLLIVDENTTIQRMIKLAFKDEGIRVTTVPRGRNAFEQIELDPPDIVLADSGREVAAFLKSRPKLSHIPVVLLKGAFDPASEGPDEALGCDDVLMKPLQPQTMIDRVKRLLLERKAGGRNAPSRSQPVASPDSKLELGQYFDQLSVAFNRTQSSTPQPPGDGWLSGVFAGNAAAEQGRASAERPDRHRQAGAAVVTDALVEQVTQRVLDRLGDRMVRSTATELVSRLSKWLLVDEVERSKGGK